MEDFKALYLQNIPCGVWRDGNKLIVIFDSTKEDCGIRWFNKGNGKVKETIAFQQEERIGNRYIKYLSYKKYADKTYMFYEAGRLVPDQNAKAFWMDNTYGITHDATDLKAYIPTDTFDWEQDEKPHLAYQDMIIYLAHVRGFTAHASSKVKSPGTFVGMQEKIPYLKKLGITTLELQPVYEFTEYPLAEDKDMSDTGNSEPALNYWGYKEGYYFAPKCAYSASGDPVSEFKKLVKTLHQNRMEIILQFYFPPEVKRGDICQILEYWATEYHVDGFHLKGVQLPIEIIAENAALKDIKFWYERPKETLRPHKQGSGMNGKWARYQDDYMYIMRRFMKGDEWSLQDALYHMRHVPAFFGKVNYLSNYFCMTMMDMVSYNEKHNEANGEENRDGIRENHSWNCGQEGMDAPEEILSLRKQQIKNGMMLLMFSRGTPLFFMGDEFGNSQNGNNNPYCQDNDVTWLNWANLQQNEELFLFAQRMITLRKDSQIAVLSYHGEQAMQIDFEPNNKHIGVLYRFGDGYYYLAVNMDENPQRLILPEGLSDGTASGNDAMVKTLGWELLLQTGASPEYDDDRKTCLLEEHSICLFKCKNI